MKLIKDESWRNKTRPSQTTYHGFGDAGAHVRERDAVLRDEEVHDPKSEKRALKPDAVVQDRLGEQADGKPDEALFDELVDDVRHDGVTPVVLFAVEERPPDKVVHSIDSFNVSDLRRLE